ncbi:MAG: hypothetical protein KJ077_10960 [Anaerolineae bacterium]|nr:hypothetical protein [Anaerolineae bacterium]
MSTFTIAHTYEINSPVWCVVTSDNIPTQGRVVAHPGGPMVQFRSVRTGALYTQNTMLLHRRVPAQPGQIVYAIVTADNVPTKSKFVRHNGDPDEVSTVTIQSVRTGKFYTVPDTDLFFEPKGCQTIKQQADLHQKIKADPTRAYALGLVEQMYQAYGIAKYYPTVFRNRNGSYHQKYLNGMHQIVLGYWNVQRTYERGFDEYDTIKRVWNGHGELKGLKGVWALILHEFAHVLQTEVKGGRTAGSVHNQVFVAKLRELQQRFPFHTA